jgi:hypothetical protein
MKPILTLAIPRVDIKAKDPGPVTMRKLLLMEYYESEWRQGLFVESVDGYLERHQKLGKRGKKVVAAIKKLEKSGNIFVPFSVRRMNKEFLGRHHCNPVTKTEVRDMFGKLSVITLDQFR